MKAWRIGLRLLRQDWRSGELYLLTAALVLTVAAVTAVGFFASRIEAGMARQGGELLAADLVLEGSDAPPAAWRDRAESQGLVSAATVEFRSVVLGADGPQLVQAKAVEPGYPLRGQLRVRADFAAAEQPREQGPPAGELWVESRLLRLLELQVGDPLTLGETDLRIGAILAYEPDAGGRLFNLAPRVLLNAADLPATGLLGPASRATHRLLLAGPEDAVADYAAWAGARAESAGFELLTASAARPEFANAVERASRFLHLASLSTLLVAGAAIALASHRLVGRQIDAVAVMRCLGARRHLLMRVFVLRLVMFGLAASLLGTALGWIAQAGLLAVFSDWFGTALPAASWSPLLVGLGTGLVTLLGFALPPLLQLAQVSPLRALRRDLGAPRGSVALAVVLAALALSALVLWQAGEFALAWKLLAGLAAALACLVVAVLALVRLAALLAGRSRGLWRLGLAALTRRPGGAVLQITGFGVGILALLLLAVVRVDLLQGWRESLPPGAPNQFAINIQPQQVEPMRTLLAAQGIEDVAFDPMIRGRLVRINDRAVAPSDYADPRAERLATREFNLSHGTRLGADNRIVAGAWWQGAEAPPQFSVERDLAETLGISLGDEIAFMVAGREVAAPVTSLREVQWDSFNVNFFVIASPALLGDEPASHITSFHVPTSDESLLVELVRRFPNLTLLDVDALLQQVRQVVDRGVLAVEYVFLFTLAAGLLVMYAGIQASLEDRRVEHAILRTLGVGRARLLGALAVEFVVAGLLAGLLASVFAEGIGWLLAEQLFGIAFVFNPWLWTVGVLGSGLLIGVAGVVATYPLLVRPPLHTLRHH
ncbi:ABC transporter permease [Marichromatium gracile]|uniref:ABC transporter permease n=1 Tax=Marichromatium gracile TaxID=1048 RepID=A0ABR5VEL3_MARGR|nr:FtsX-like permease family protein [Marichromatium gracile]KXX64163.1 ABC transporter permease [Marichromatium gracile]